MKDLKAISIKENLILLGIILTIHLGCTDKEKSPIEVLKLDNQVIAEISDPKNSDSISIEYPKEKDIWSIEHYYIEPNKENLIFRDSLKNVVGYYKRIDGKNYEGAEYYPNGQIIGKLNYIKPGVFDGEAKYFYPNGQIKSIGNWKGFKKIGTWKNYKTNGDIKSINEYDDKGKLLNAEKTNH